MMLATRSFAGGALNRAAAIGLACGAAFALAGIGYRAASLALADTGGLLMRPAFTLAYVTLVQSLVLTIWLWRRAEGWPSAPSWREWRLKRWSAPRACWRRSAGSPPSRWPPLAQVKAVGHIEPCLQLADLALRLRRAAEPARDRSASRLVAGGILLLILTS